MLPPARPHEAIARVFVIRLFSELFAERLKVNEFVQESIIMARRRRQLEPKGKDEDVRMTAGLITAGVVSIVIVASMFIAPPANVGPEEGSLAPDFVA